MIRNSLLAPMSTMQKALAGMVFVILAFFLTFRITESPPFGFDEGWVVQVASNIALSGVDGLQFAPGDIQHVSVLTSVGYPLIYALALWVKLFGIGVFEARLMMAVYSLAFALVAFLFLRRLYGNALALCSLAILASFPPFYTFGKMIIGEVPVLFFLLSFLLFFNLAISGTKSKKFWLILAGISAGICISTKTMCVIFAPVLFVGAIVAWKRGLVTGKEIGIVAGSAILPVIVWIISNFQPGDSISSVLDYYTNPSAITDKTSVFWQNLKLLFTRGGALFMVALMGAWFAGMFVRAKEKSVVGVEELIAFIFGTLLLVSLLFRYMDARYLFPVQVLGILFAPYSLYRIFLSPLIKITAPRKAIIFYCAVGMFCLSGLYQTMFHSFVADSYDDTFTAEMSQYFSSLPESTVVFFYNTPHMVPFYKGEEYYQRIAMFDKWLLGSEFRSIVTARQADILVLNGLMTKEDQTLSLEGYSEVKSINEFRILKKK